MSKLFYDPKSHFDVYKEKRERQAHQRAVELKFRSNLGRSSAFQSKLTRELQQAQLRKARRNVTLAPCAFLDKPDPDSI